LHMMLILDEYIDDHAFATRRSGLGGASVPAMLPASANLLIISALFESDQYSQCTHAYNVI
jgi:hypothetical protein